MFSSQFLQKGLAVSGVLTIGLLSFFSYAGAAPTQAPPNGNPAFPAGPVGPRGDTGPQGPGGNQGNQGNQGNTGPSGQAGIGACNWTGTTPYNRLWINHGFDAYTGCNGSVGLYFYCEGSRMTRIEHYINYGSCENFYNHTNPSWGHNAPDINSNF